MLCQEIEQYVANNLPSGKKKKELLAKAPSLAYPFSKMLLPFTKALDNANFVSLSIDLSLYWYRYPLCHLYLQKKKDTPSQKKPGIRCQ